MKTPSNGYSANSGEGERKAMNSELWHACAGPLVSLPPVGSLVVYFPQGHSEQVAASMQKHTDDVPGYPNLPSKLICMLHNVTLHADPETDEVYAQMTLQPVNKCDQEALLVSDMGLKQNRQPSEFFCKTLTNSDTSTHGGFSVPRRAAEKIFPPLDFSMQPPAQELVARDLHDQAWTFRHIFRGQPKRHLLTTGWSVFISSKRLIAGDSVLFIRDDKSQHLLGIRRANKQQPALSSSVISSDSMHIGILAAAAHAAANSSPFTIFYNPRASPCEFVIPLAKYNKAMYNQVSLGMRFRMMFETEDCGVRRYMGTISGVGDLDPVRWKSSQWRNLQVGWDESAAGERPNRVSIWEIEPVVTPFYICPPPFFRPKFPKQPGFPDDECDTENGFKRGMPWVNDGLGLKDGSSSMFPGLNLVQWMSMQQQNTQPGLFPSNLSPNDHSKLLSFQSPQYSPSALQFGKPNPLTQPPSWPHHQPHPQPQPQARQQPQQHHNQNHQQYHQQNHQQNYQQNHQQQQMQQIMQSSGVNTSVVHNQSPHQQSYSHLQQQNVPVVSRSLPQESQFHQQSDQHQRSQMPSFPDQQIQLQILQKLQQKHQQQQQIMPSFTPVTSYLEPQTLQQHLPLPQRQLSGTSFSTTPLLQSPQSQQKQSVIMKVNSGPIDVDVPSCSTSPSTNNCQVLPSNFINKNQGRSIRMEAPQIDATSNPVQDLQRHSAIRMKDEVTSLKGTSSATSYSMDANTLQQNFSVPNYSIEGDVQLNSRNTLPFTEHIDGLTPDALLSRGYDSGKEIQNLLSDYDTNRDFETDLSNAGINIQSFGMPQNMSFKSGCSNDVPVNVNDTNILNNGVWPNGPNQTQPPPRMRTYTKVQKRGSVGRTIDVTRYKDYNELRHDLARMFGIEGQLEDSQRTDWKLVYVDHENDILLVGDDPWEEFVSCVQSIKILSTGEVQQMSLNGDLGGHVAVTVPNQACSGSESGNAWRGQYDDNSAASFNQ